MRGRVARRLVEGLGPMAAAELQRQRGALRTPWQPARMPLGAASASTTAATPAHLRLVHGPPARYAEHECALVGRGGAAGDAEARIPAAVDALAGVLEVQLHALQGAGVGGAV